MPPFTPEERERLREALVAAARSDGRIEGAAHTGSGSVGRLDRWSDIDLALRVADGADIAQLLNDWTRRMYDEHGAVAHVDVRRGATLFRVFLLESTLQVDIAFWPSAEFGAIAPTFRLAFGSANARPPAPPVAPAELIGMAWLYALHVRSSVCRGRPWQAEYMLSAMRDHVLALMCLRHGLSPREARGADDLPRGTTARLETTLVSTLDRTALTSAFDTLTAALLDEAWLADAELASRLTGPLSALLADCDRCDR